MALSSSLEKPSLVSRSKVLTLHPSPQCLSCHGALVPLLTTRCGRLVDGLASPEPLSSLGPGWLVPVSHPAQCLVPCAFSEFRKAFRARAHC